MTGRGWRGVVLLALALLSTACSPGGTPSAAPTAALFTAIPTATATPTQPSATPPPELISPAELRLTAVAAINPTPADDGGLMSAAQTDLAARLGVSPEQVEVLRVEDATWGWAQLACLDAETAAAPDPTLTLTATSAVTLTQTALPATPTTTGTLVATSTVTRTPTLTPTASRTPVPTRTPTATATPAPVAGRHAWLLVDETVYEARLTTEAVVFCVEGSLYDDYPALLLARDPVAAELVAVAQGRLGRELDLPEAVMQPVSVRPVTWPDASLGCPAPDQTYPPRPIPGYRIVLRVGERDYPFHTDFERLLRCDDPAPPG